MSIPITDRLSAISVTRILLVLLFVTAPHYLRLPLWASAAVIGLGGWRALAAFRGWTLPSSWIRIPLAIAAFVGIAMHYHGLRGQNAGVALLVVMTALKLTEMGSRRDYTVTVFLAYFLLITHFLYSQEIVMVGYLLLGTIAVTAVLIDLNHPQSQLALPVAVRRSLLITGQAVPVMLLFFVLFPRIPGPLWGLPSDAGAGQTGLSDRMEPGLISSLSQSDEVAFRVTFDGPVPERHQLYWRGPVFWRFDGVGWDEGYRHYGLRRSELKRSQFRAVGEPVRYEAVLEPHGQRWLLALDHPEGALPSGSILSYDGQMLSKNRVIDRRLIRLQAYPRFQWELELADLGKHMGLDLPRNTNPRTRELAQSWRAAAESDWGIVQAALRHFREQDFTYTLQPPLLQDRRDRIDEFLFESRRGFCEHFASAFTVLMRSAGIPARVVTGYQGGEHHEAGGYYIVRQSDAHAWSEVWIYGRGWLRIDPTGAVSPDRIEFGLGSLPLGEPVPGLARFNRGWIQALQLRWDQINAGWNRWVLAYGPELQQELLRLLGLPGLRQAILALTVFTVVVLSLVSAHMVWQSRPMASDDLIWRDWLRFRRKLGRRGIRLDDSEGPRDFGERLAREAPEFEIAARPIIKLYIRLRYGAVDSDELRSQFRRRVRKFPRL